MIDAPMEFFRLKRLNATLVRGPLPALDTAKYLAAQGVLWSLIVIPSPADAPADWTLLGYPAISLLGVYYCYRRHGGASGERFAERYLKKIVCALKRDEAPTERKLVRLLPPIPARARRSAGSLVIGRRPEPALSR